MIVRFDGGSRLNYRRSLIASDFATSTFTLPYPSSQVVKKITVFLRSRSKKIKITQSNPSLLMVDIQERQIFKRPWVKINLVFIVSSSSNGSLVTVLAIAWGETGINPPSVWDEQIDPKLVNKWVSEKLIPSLRKP
jgi:hypothetical protein